MRGLHYLIVSGSGVKPDGMPYTNTDKDWIWLSEVCAKAARWLGYIPFDPPRRSLSPRSASWGSRGRSRTGWRWSARKSSLADVLDPLSRQYDTDLYLPTGEISDTQVHAMAKAAQDDGRPLVVLYFADCDPAGWQMGISVARKLQACRFLLPEMPDFELHRVALTPQQVREYGLPSTPLKEKEKRADRWRAAMGIEQTEIDALAALRPDLLRQVTEDAIRPFYDHTLASRVSAARRDWLRRAQEAVEQATGSEYLDEIRAAAASQLEDMREQIAELNEALRIDLDEEMLPPFDVPSADLNGPRPPVRSWTRVGRSLTNASASSHPRRTTIRWPTAVRPPSRSRGTRDSGLVPHLIILGQSRDSSRYWMSVRGGDRREDSGHYRPSNSFDSGFVSRKT